MKLIDSVSPLIQTVPEKNSSFLSHVSGAFEDSVVQCGNHLEGSLLNVSADQASAGLSWPEHLYTR